MSISKFRLYSLLRILFTALFISALLVSPLFGVIKTAAASSETGSDAITPGLQAAIEEALGPETFPPTEKAILSASDKADGDQFGWANAIDGDTAVFGASKADSGGTDRGQAYVFYRNPSTGVWTQAAILTASDAADGDRFGYTVAIDADTIIVGAPWADSGGTDRGQAYVFERDNGGADNWGQTKILTASNAVNNDRYAETVAIYGDTAVTGTEFAPSGGVLRGHVYIYERDNGGADNWGQTKILTASDEHNDGRFGNMVDIDGDTIIAGGRWIHSGGLHRGQAYIYDRNNGGLDNWGQTKILQASDEGYVAQLGTSVAISGDTVVVGAYNADSGGSNRGQAYVYDRDNGGADNWGQTKILKASDQADLDIFAYVDIEGDVVVVGAPYADSGGTDRGQAYIFTRDNGGTDNWGEKAILTASDQADDDHFGILTIGISGDTVIIGAYHADSGGTDRGQSYVFNISPSVGNFVWDDLDADGVQDGGELGLGGVSVILYDANPLAPDDPSFPQSYAVVATTVTAGDGSYAFNDLTPGTYFLYFMLPSGYLFSPQDQGGDDTLDSDADQYGLTDFFSLILLQDDTTRDVGMYQLASIGDYVWEDTDEDGLQDVGETGMSGVTVELYENGVGLADTTTTASDGSYSFTGLTPGDYYVKFYEPTGASFSLQDQGGDDALDSDADTSTGQTAVTFLTSGEDDDTWDAGLYLINYLTNGGFEDPLGAEWTEIISANGDGRTPFNQAHEGSYMYLFQADGGLEVVKQVVAQSGDAGDEYTLTLHFGGKDVDLSGYLGARLTFKNGGATVDTKTCILTPPASNFSWTEFTCTLTATGAFDSIEVLIGIQNVASGMVGVDAAILNKTGP